jgi:hypothetical protein
VVIVADATGWQVGDRVIVAGNTLGNTDLLETTVSSISGNTVTLAANLAEIKRAGTPISNFSSNISFQSTAANRPVVSFLATSGSSPSTQYIKNLLVQGCGNSGGGSSPGTRSALGFRSTRSFTPLSAIDGVAIYNPPGGSSAASAIGFALDSYRNAPFIASNIAIYTPTITGISFGDGNSDVSVTNVAVFDSISNGALSTTFGAGGQGVVINDSFFGGKAVPLISVTAGGGFVFNNCVFKALTSVIRPESAGSFAFNSCKFNKIGTYEITTASVFLDFLGASANGNISITSPDSSSGVDFANLAALQTTPPSGSFVIRDLTAYKRFDRSGGKQIDSSVVNLGANSLRFEPVSATFKNILVATITLPGVVTVKVAGALRKNAAYGASDRPFAQISGSVITTQTFTMPDSADTWEPFLLSATASGSGTITFRMQAENTGVASRAYLDGVLQVRAFGYEEAPLPLLNPTVDLATSLLVPTITSGDSTAAAAAITGIAVNFSTDTITISSSRTVEQLINYHEVQWAQTLGADRLFTTQTISTITTAATLSLGATLTGNVTTTGNITITVTGNYSTTNATLASSSTLTVPNGTTTLRGWVFASGATVSGSGSAIVEVDANQIANITASGGVIVRSVPVVFSGFPTGNNVNSVPFNSIIAIRNTSDSTLFTGSASSGSVAVSLSTIGNGVGPFSVWGDGRGVRRTIEQSITVSRSDDVVFSGLFEEFVNESGQVLVGLAAADSGVTYDAGNTRFLFASASSTFLGVLHQFDLLTSSEAGQAYNNDAVRGIRFVQNAFVRTIFLPSPFTIAATADAPTARTLVDCRIIRPDGSDARAYGLASTVYAGDRPIVAFPFAVQEYVGLTAQAARDSLKLAPSAGSPAAGSVDADLDTLVARNNPLDAAGTRSAVGLGSANLDTQLTTIDTVVDAILVDTDATIPAQITARTLVAADYFDPATDTVANVTTVSTVTDKSGYGLSDGAITPAKIQDGAFTSAKFASGAFDAVWTAATRTLTAIADSSGVTTLLSRLTSGRAGNLDNLDATISSRSTYSGGDTAGTTTLLSRIASALTITSGKVTVGTNDDKTGYSLTTPPLDSTATQAAAAAALNAYDPPTRAELTSDIGTVTGAIAGLNNLSTAQVNSEVDTALADVGLTPTVTGRIDAAISSRLSTAGYTAPANADITAIKAKTDNLPSDPADQSAVEAAITAAQSAILAGGFTASDRNILIAAEAAAKAVASGRHKINYAASTATQYNADGTVRTVFDLVDEDGDPATSGASAVERVPR